MAEDFNANDIFEIAVKIEENGAAFYRAAADKMDDEKHKEFLLEFARMEDEHVVTFTQMKNQLDEMASLPTVFDPENESMVYLKALADTRVFHKKKEPESSFSSILATALQTEKDSIAFYLGMKDLVPERQGKEKINDIIKEEMSHIKIIARKMNA